MVTHFVPGGKNNLLGLFAGIKHLTERGLKVFSHVNVSSLGKQQFLFDNHHPAIVLKNVF